MTSENPYKSPDAAQQPLANQSAAPEMPTARRGSLLVIFLSVFIDLLGFAMVLPLLPAYASDFGAKENGIEIGLLMASFSAMQFLFSPAWGRLSDRIGRRPVLMIGLAGSVVFYTLFGFATVWKSMFWLFVSRIGAGIAGATITTAQAYIADTTTLENRGKGMALIGAAFGLGFTFGPLFGGLTLMGSHGAAGPEPGFAAAALSAFALGLAYFKLPESLTTQSKTAGRRLFDFSALGDAIRTPSVGPILLTLFVCILAFANFETTLSLLLKHDKAEQAPFKFTYEQVMYTFSYIGLMLTLAQGLVVRRLLGKIHEATMGAAGAVFDVVGFGVMILAVQSANVPILFVAFTLMVFGFSMMMPSLNSLLSRRSDPAKQGGILGLGQSVSALARILGPMLGIPLLTQRAFQHLVLPYWVGGALMVVALLLMITAGRRGQDYGAPAEGQAMMLE